jgi:hypothetical protein
VVTGKLTGPNLPPGQDVNVQVDDRNNGQYVLHLNLKAPSDIKLIINVARDTGPGALPEAGREFPHLSLKFESLKAFKAREEREALKTEAAKHKAAEGAEGEDGAPKLRRRNTMTNITAMDSIGSVGSAAEPAAAPAAETAMAPAAVVVDAKAGGSFISKAGAKAKGAKLKKAANEMMEGFGRRDERRAKQVTGSATKAVEVAVEAMQDEVKRAKVSKVK